MEITWFAIIWIILILIAFFSDIKYMIMMYVLSFLFHAAAIINVGNSCLDVIMFTAIIFIVRVLVADAKIRIEKIDRQILILCLISIISIPVAAIMFNDVQVITLMNVYQHVVGYGNLNIGIDNLTMLLSLCIYSSAFVLLNHCRDKIETGFSHKIFIIALEIVLFFGVWQWLDTMGIIPQTILKEFIYSNKAHWNSIAYGKGNASYNSKIFSTFSEPSYAGVFLAASFWYLLLKNDKTTKEKCLLVITGIELLINMSGSGIGGFIAGAVCYYWISFKAPTKRKMQVIIVSILVLILFTQTKYMQVALDYVAAKLRSYSYFERSNYNAAAMQAFWDTYWIGAGYGSIRASGVVQNILGQIGILGLIVYGRFVLTLLKRLGIGTPFGLFLISVIGAQILSCADITLSSFWFVAVLIKVRSFEPILNEKPAEIHEQKQVAVSK